MSAIAKVTTHRDAIALAPDAHDPVSMTLGGITLWARTQDELDAGLGQLQMAIEEVASSQLSCVRSVLKKLVRENLGEPKLDDKVFSAILGASLRCGRLDTVVCGSKNDKPYRVFVHVAQLPRWRKASDTAITMLQTRRVLAVRELEKSIFGTREYNTWSSTSHVLAALSYRGIVRFVENGTCHFVTDVF